MENDIDDALVLKNVHSIMQHLCELPGSVSIVMLSLASCYISILEVLANVSQVEMQAHMSSMRQTLDEIQKRHEN
jgi:hypothetical protein